jgi:pimeloyl-ACP methyl ester carboxylesterase
VAYPSLLLVHGAANGAWVWDAWRAALRPFGWEVNVLDLRGHGRSLPADMTEVTMEVYVNDLESVCEQITAVQGRHPVVGGWSMGGLVAMMYAAKAEDVPGLLLFAPSPPLEVQGRTPAGELRSYAVSPFGPEVYGVHVDDAEASRAAMPDLTDEEIARVLERSVGATESGLARRQRKAGISVPSVAAPSMLIYGDQDEPAMRRSIATHLGSDSMMLPGAGHWGIVYSERMVSVLAPGVDNWLRRTLEDA